MSENENLGIKFGGSLHEIDIDLFIQSLLSYSFVAQESASYLSPETKINIKIQAPKQGSFIILLSLVAEEVGTLFDRENINLAASVISVVAGLYTFKKWISKNGKPEIVEPIEGNNIKISNTKGDIIINQNVYNIYQENPKVRENLRKTFSRLEDREEISSFSMYDIDSGESLFEAKKEEFKDLSSDLDEIEQKRQKIIINNQELSVFKIIFKENYKWEFYYQGIKIYAALMDPIFFKKIEKGEVAFRSGDRLVVDLEIKQVFNESANTFVNEDYNIISVRSHIPRVSSTQYTFGFENIDNNDFKKEQ